MPELLAQDFTWEKKGEDSGASISNQGHLHQERTWMHQYWMWFSETETQYARSLTFATIGISPLSVPLCSFRLEPLRSKVPFVTSAAITEPSPQFG